MEKVVSENEITTVANTDIITDYTVKTDGVLHIAVVTADAGDVRITLDGTNYSTVLDTPVDVWTVINIPVTGQDVFNIQTVDIEVASIRVLLEEL